MPQMTVRVVDAELVAKRLQDLGAAIPKISTGAIYGRMMAAQKRITKYPPKWSGSLPKNWFKSDKQRRKVFALLREGAIPYQRTFKYRDAWQVRKIKNGYMMDSASLPYAKYVGGNARGGEQAKIHRDRWAIASAVLRQEFASLAPEINEKIRISGKRLGL